MDRLPTEREAHNAKLWSGNGLTSVRFECQDLPILEASMLLSDLYAQAVNTNRAADHKRHADLLRAVNRDHNAAIKARVAVRLAEAMAAHAARAA